MNLILLRRGELSNDSPPTATLKPDDDRTKHIVGRLNKKSGDTVSVGIIGGRRGKATVEYVLSGDDRRDDGNRDDDNDGENDTRNRRKFFNKHSNIANRHHLKLTLLPNETPFTHPPKNEPEITLLLALPFPSRLKSLWSTIASFCYVTEIVIVRGRLSDPDFGKSSALSPEIYQKSIENGMSQGGRTRPVEVRVCLGDGDDAAVVSREFLLQMGLAREGSTDGEESDGTARIFLDCGDETASVPSPVREVVLKHCRRSGEATNAAEFRIPKVVVAVGPERGWTDEEAAIFVGECGFESATLGSSILRVDTAVIAGLGIISASLDECWNDSKSSSDDKNKRRKLI